MPVLTLVVGVPAGGRSALARDIARKQNSLFLNECEIEERLCRDAGLADRNDQVFSAVKTRLADAMREGKSVVLDAANRTARYRRPYLELARSFGHRTEAVLLNIPLEQALEQNRQREARGERSVAESAIRRYERYLRIPTLAEGFDRIEVRTTEQQNPEAAAFFQEQEQRLVRDPVGLIRELERDGRLERWLPELHRAIPVDQHNSYHHFTVYEHILKATEVVAGTSLHMVWTLLLHDIGKAYPGIKQFTGVTQEPFDRFRKREKIIIDNGADIREGRDSGRFYIVQGTRIPAELVNTDLQGHFYEHENVGAQMAFRILTRFGYPHEFALHVATLIQFHMMMPRGVEKVDLAEIRQWYDRVGPYAAELMHVRLADTRGK